MNKFIISICFIFVLILHLSILINTKISENQNIQTLENSVISLKLAKNETKIEIQKEEIISEKKTEKTPLQTKTIKDTDKPSPIKKETKKEKSDTPKIDERIVENTNIQDNKQEIQKEEETENNQKQILKENDSLKKYQAELREEINKNKVYPNISKKLKEEGKVIVSFRVMKNGLFENIRVNTSSNIKRLDEAALNALYATNKFKSFENISNKDYLDFELPIEFITIN